ncbi:MAG: hypothetical protein QNJ40_19355 [Xanthomonadales bacterium]|nr:hypothetical protein [Xanthomonadales bacterium]
MTFKTLVTLATGAVMSAIGAVGFVLLVFPDHWRVAAMEQWLLRPWLGPSYLGDGQPVSDLLLCNPMGLAIHPSGDLLISDRGRDRRGRVVWRIGKDGVARIFAGNGLLGKPAPGRAINVSFDRPESMAVTADGSVLLSDGFSHAIFRIDASGDLSIFAGTGTPGFSGDNGLATDAELFRPADIKFDSLGNLYVADVRNHRIRKIDVDGVITTVAGTGEPGFSPDGTAATQAQLDSPWGVAVDKLDRLVIADSNNHRIRRVEANGLLTTVAGTGEAGFDGDGGPAVLARLNVPEALFIDHRGVIYFGDENNNAVRLIALDGTIDTLLGTGSPGRAEPGKPAAGSPVDDPETVLIRNGEVIISDGNNGRVLRITVDGVVGEVAGRGDITRCSSRW